MSKKDVVIVSGARTPMGGFQGYLSGASAVDLGTIAIRAAIERAQLQDSDIEIEGQTNSPALLSMPNYQSIQT